MNYKLIIFTLVATLFTYIQASSSDSDASSVAESAASFDNSAQAPCIQCPPTKKVYIHCKKKKQLYLTTRTCYKCPEYKCVKKKYIKGDKAKFCKKILPTCKNGCAANQTCFISVQTRYSCSKAKCIPRFLNRDTVIDMDYNN